MHSTIAGRDPFLAVLCLSVAGGWLATRYLLRANGAYSKRMPLLLLALIALAVAGAKVMALIERGGPLSFSEELTNGYRYPGGLFAVLVGLPVLWSALAPGISFLAVFDSVVPSIGVSVALMRIACFLRGCCAGAPCAYTWCIEYPKNSPPFLDQMRVGLIVSSASRSLAVHPLPIYFAVASLAAVCAAVAYRRFSALPIAGGAGLLFLAVHEGQKYLLEQLRLPPSVSLQRMSLAVSLVSGGLFLICHYRVGSLTRYLSRR